jgi:hypothetical protein
MITIIKLVLAIILMTYGFTHLSEPSNTHVWLGVSELILGLALMIYTFYNFLKETF